LALYTHVENTCMTTSFHYEGTYMYTASLTSQLFIDVWMCQAWTNTNKTTENYKKKEHDTTICCCISVINVYTFV